MNIVEGGRLAELRGKSRYRADKCRFVGTIELKIAQMRLPDAELGLRYLRV